jgi:hypothetical protein
MRTLITAWHYIVAVFDAIGGALAWVFWVAYQFAALGMILTGVTGVGLPLALLGVYLIHRTPRQYAIVD